MLLDGHPVALHLAHPFDLGRQTQRVQDDIGDTDQPDGDQARIQQRIGEERALKPADQPDADREDRHQEIFAIDAR